MQHVHLFVCLWFSCLLHLILCLDVASICLLVCLSKVFEKVLDFLWFPFKGGEGGQGVQKGRWRDNTRKIIGPQWSIQQEGGGGTNPPCPLMTGRHDEMDWVGQKRGGQVVLTSRCEGGVTSLQIALNSSWQKPLDLCSNQSAQERDGKIRHLLTDWKIHQRHLTSEKDGSASGYNLSLTARQLALFQIEPGQKSDPMVKSFLSFSVQIAIKSMT